VAIVLEDVIAVAREKACCLPCCSARELDATAFARSVERLQEKSDT
jgi:hypothetical protein